mmetsp:Transcript_46227/g.91617  ORF Transcript_46227/g.91617 Transcript_46227/m.91617 type:complete len:80 (-) Transcript_46227:1004-1243(-)
MLLEIPVMIGMTNQYHPMATLDCLAPLVVVNFFVLFVVVSDITVRDDVVDAQAAVVVGAQAAVVVVATVVVVVTVVVEG